MKLIPAILATLLAAVSAPVLAGPHGDALGTCLSDNTSGKERKDLARWIFIAAAAHPEMTDLSAATADVRLRANQSVGRLFTRLLSENCPVQARVAVEKEGSTAMQDAFGTLGKIAMQELMSNPAVNTAISGFEAYVDRAKIQAAVAPK